jgi:hypothetical protein
MNPQKEPQTPKPPELLNEYPTDEQMETVFNAWKKDGEEGIRRALGRLYPRTPKAEP